MDEKKLKVKISDFEDRLKKLSKEEKLGKPNIKKMIVAFLDMIGTSELMKSINAESAENAVLTLQSITQTFDTLINHYRNKNPNSDICYMEISDSFVIGVEEQYLQELIEIIALLQLILLSDHGLLLRGGIAKGNLVSNYKENKVIGPAFVAAYKLEKENAVFPRVIFQNGLVDDSFELVAKDDDGLTYIDFMRYFDSKDRLPNCLEFTDKNIKIFSENEKTLRELQKWNWLRTYLDKYQKEVQL